MSNLYVLDGRRYNAGSDMGAAFSIQFKGSPMDEAKAVKWANIIYGVLKKKIEARRETVLIALWQGDRLVKNYPRVIN